MGDLKDDWLKFGSRRLASCAFRRSARGPSSHPEPRADRGEFGAGLLQVERHGRADSGERGLCAAGLPLRAPACRTRPPGLVKVAVAIERKIEPGVEDRVARDPRTALSAFIDTSSLIISPSKPISPRMTSSTTMRDGSRDGRGRERDRRHRRSSPSAGRERRGTARNRARAASREASTTGNS